MSDVPPGPVDGANASPSAFSTAMREIVKLAIPLALVQLGTSLVGVIDTAVMGRTTPQQLAAVGLGNSLLFSLSIFGMGAVLGTEPLIAQALGAGDPTRARRHFRQGIWTALLVAPLVLAAALVVVALLPRAGVDADVVPFARRYILARAPGVLPFLLYWSVKAWLQAHGRTTAPVVGVVIGVLVEAALDPLLVFGSATLHLPALGVSGAGIAHSCTSAIRLLIVVLAAEEALRDEGVAGEARPTSWAERWRRMRGALIPSELMAIVKIGVPLGLTMSLEVAVFAFAALTMGRLGAHELASHQVAIQCASTTFNVMVGLGSATSVVVGRRIGARDKDGALQAGLAALALSTAFMVLTGALFLFGGRALAQIFTNAPDVIAGAATLLAVAAAFQLSDGLQTVMSGALRGAGDTRATFVIHLIAHWGIGMPCVIALSGVLGAPGVWWGLTLGLTAAAVALVARFLVQARRGYEPVALR